MANFQSRKKKKEKKRRCSKINDARGLVRKTMRKHTELFYKIYQIF